MRNRSAKSCVSKTKQHTVSGLGFSRPWTGPLTRSPVLGATFPGVACPSSLPFCNGPSPLSYRDQLGLDVPQPVQDCSLLCVASYYPVRQSWRDICDRGELACNVGLCSVELCSVELFECDGFHGSTPPRSQEPTLFHPASHSAFSTFSTLFVSFELVKAHNINKGLVAPGHPTL